MRALRCLLHLTVIVMTIAGDPREEPSLSNLPNLFSSKSVTQREITF
jgi:hypothetical protein